MHCRTEKLIAVLCAAALLSGCTGTGGYSDDPDGSSGTPPVETEEADASGSTPETDQYEDVTDEPMTFTYNGREYKGSFTGTLKNGKPEGEGTFISEKTDVTYFSFQGEWIGGEPIGEGQMKTDGYTIDFGSVKRTGMYSGAVKGLLAEGTGLFGAENDDGEIYFYTGEFADGTFNGYGKREFTAVDKYGIEAGNFTDGIFDPTFAQEIQYIFSFKDKMKMTLSQKVTDFIDKDPEGFIYPEKESIYLEEYEGYDPSNEPGITKLEGLTVTQTIEENGYNHPHLSIIAKNSRYVFDIRWFGDNMDITVGDTVTAYVLALGDSYYMSTAGLRIDATAALAVWLEKTEE